MRRELKPRAIDSGSVVDPHVEDLLGPLFAELRASTTPSDRPREFELLLQKLFRLSGYDARRGPPIARPRQTDLLARRGDQLYLLEAKWQRDPADINDLDSLHARLRRAPRGTIGCFFCMSSYTESAIDEVTNLRSAQHGGYEILLFDQNEIAALFAGHRRLVEAIATKLRAIREEGATIFQRAAVEKRLRLLDIPFPSPETGRVNDLKAPFDGRAYNFAFGDVPNALYNSGDRMPGFQLYGNADISDVEELTAFLQLLHSRLRFTGRGGYTITEVRNQKVWLGTSAQRLTRSLLQLRERYAFAKLKDTHHSEEFTFYDVTHLGALLVSGRQNVTARRIYGTSFELRLPGIPLDVEPLRSLTSELGTYFEQLTPVEESISSRVPLPPGLLVEPLEYLMEPTGAFCVAAVVRNPFWARAGKTRHDEIPELLRNTSILMGRISDYLAHTERVRQFQLKHIQLIHFREGTVINVFLGHHGRLRYNLPDTAFPPVGQEIKKPRQLGAKTSARKGRSPRRREREA